jgi:DNA polymerase-3 subunit gamma/tau
VVEKLFQTGADFSLFGEDLLHQIRNLLMVKIGGDNSQQLVDLAESEIDGLKLMGSHLTEEDIHLLFDMALKGINDLKRSPDTKITLEMLLLRMVHAPRVRNLLTLKSNVISVSGGSNSGNNGPTPPVKVSPTPRPPIATPAPSMKTQEEAPAKPQVKEYNPAISLSENWFHLIETLKSLSPIMGAKLDNTHALSLEGQQLIIGVPEKLTFLSSQIKNRDFINSVNEHVNKYWKTRYEVKFEMVGAHVGVTSPKIMREEQESKKTLALRKQIEDHQLIQEAQKVFKTEITSIKEMP